MRRSARFYGSAIIALALLAGSSDAFGRWHPHKPLLSSTPQSVSGASSFDCGTFKGNERESAALYHRYRSVMRRAPARAAADFVYDDVWVVEDDGTLIITGNNVFDTDNQAFRFSPDGSGGYEVVSVVEAIDPVPGTDLGLGDDASSTVALGFDFNFYGTSWSEAHVSSNGGVSFGGDLNPSGFFDSNDFFDITPTLAVYYLDLNPAASGAVYSKMESTHATFTWLSVPEYGTNKFNTFQLVLRDDGSFDFIYGGIQSTSQTNGAPITVGVNPGAQAPLVMISFSDDTPFTGNPGEGMYEQYVNLVNPLVNEVALMQRFYQSFPDEFFQTVFFTNFPQTMAGFANERNIENHVEGIGLDLFDNSALYGSNGVLESRCNMNRLGAWLSDPTARFLGGGNSFLSVMGQESGHRWGAFMNFMDGDGQVSNLILGRSDAHWSYYADVDHSSLEGGDWEYTGFQDRYTTPTSVDFFSDIDEYAFGIRSPEEVSEFFYLSSPTNDLVQNRSAPPPLQGVSARGTPVTVTIEDIVAAEGPRVPAERLDKDLRQAFMLVHQAGNAPTQGELDKIATFRRAWEEYFERSVDGRLSLNTSITQTYPVAVLEGHVRNAGTAEPVANLVVLSTERGFQQVVPGGGRYTFRYMADETSGDEEHVTLFAIAEGYLPAQITTDLSYGTTTTMDIDLQPVMTPATVQSYDAAWVGHGVEVTWELVDLDAEISFAVYRRIDDGAYLYYNNPNILEDSGRYTFIDEMALPGHVYHYRVVIFDGGQSSAQFETAIATPQFQTVLYQNQPNPFNPSTVVPFVLGEPSHVTVAVYDVQGRLVRTLYEGTMPPGFRTVEWDGRNNVGHQVGGGVYFYRLKAGRTVQTRRMVRLK